MFNDKPLWKRDIQYVNFEYLKNKVVHDVYIKDNEEIYFELGEEVFVMFHNQDCCERVVVEDITGDLQDLIGNEVLLAEEATKDAGEAVYESGTWTFYKLGTIKGYVDIRWLGESNGFYSEKVDCAVFEKGG